ncbi:MspA family porin [Antrihabitans sp. YC2-6]|uniref:MspA family porin n=1 Tax=Antrihabitans sp. YC2-6 TaxID=2799498 RepID=UPI0018F28864|nr:MspA family porin [Antrihabitans sp. YC2-6]MBJ8344085.1 MspA family porin [Antrihabitans sp. YC2-6]
MTETRTFRRRRGLGFIRAVAIASVATIALALGNSGTASAALDGSAYIVDGGGNRIEAQTIDTSISFVPPLDGNPVSREFFHSGRAGFVAGDDFSGTVTLGYQIGYPATADGRVYFKWQSPDLELDLAADQDGAGIALLFTNLIPVIGMEIGASFGPGIVSVDVAEGSVTGGSGSIAIGGIQGTVTGVLGQTSIRPYVKVVSDNGDTVVAYGPIFRN